MAESAAVRSAQASTTVRARDSEIDAKDPSVAGEKHTTSHRPTLAQLPVQTDVGQRVERTGCVIGFERRTERRRPVLEHGDVVGARDLGRVLRCLRRERVLVGRRQERTVLPARGDGDPLAGQDVLAHPRGLGPRIERTLVDGTLSGQRAVRIVEVEQVAAVRELRHALGDHRNSLAPIRSVAKAFGSKRN
ncbi:hypothetical protein QP157_06230 [Sphingomonas sp. LR61]|uniref:hypothetical protein n=1 Tax=Sphingomonas sp. LR61 TaxID=3050234 RepID=UPI002FE2F9C3